MSQLEKMLVEIGLDENEAVVYAALLKLKSASAGEIAKESGTWRRSVYDTINVLLKKGYISYITKNGVKHYQTAGMDRLKDEIKRKERVFEAMLPLLPSLEDRKIENSVSVYEGADGIKSILRSSLEFAGDGGEIVGFGEKGNLTKLIRGFMDSWHAQRVKRKIRIRRLFNRDQASEKSVKKLFGAKLTEQRMMPEGFGSSLGVWTCKDRTIMWFVKEDPLAIVIENKEIANGFRKQFDFLWEVAGIVKH